MRMRWAGIGSAIVLTVAAGCASGSAGGEASGPMVLATTTSTQNSGLLDAVLPDFESTTGCTAKTVAVGSGQAMAMGERGEADAVLVHSPEAEERFMEQGHGSLREPVMHNDFVLVGPPGDPVDLDGSGSAAEAMRRIAEEGAAFASRADDSGTHAKELSLWEEAGTEHSGSAYIETGQGMGETLTIASQRQAYTLTDRGTFLATSGLDSEIAFEGTDDLRNDYHVIVVDGESVNSGCAEAFAEWIRDEPTQEAIAEFGTEEYGEPLFFPDAVD
ncbi:tungstate transport system substrate-binding protein [Haloechinothrix alba]|uniref:Tungstate transport system substrate-binding protein n=1 Tax=Haloechinothrix alba TaxID=664784 RepID=A0A238YPZ5_9PSEU|nr:substrate-binding domain-containing protein [Haloechinothrix alba]SNR73062.1 tungstate transport system substrate-binding protein [Haloechinothrix alba]